MVGQAERKEDRCHYWDGSKLQCISELHPKYVLMAVAVENDKGSAMFDAELERRCMIMHTNPTVKQTERVIKHKLLAFSTPRQ